MANLLGGNAIMSHVQVEGADSKIKPPYGLSDKEYKSINLSPFQPLPCCECVYKTKFRECSSQGKLLFWGHIEGFIHIIINITYYS